MRPQWWSWTLMVTRLSVTPNNSMRRQTDKQQAARRSNSTYTETSPFDPGFQRYVPGRCVASSDISFLLSSQQMFTSYPPGSWKFAKGASYVSKIFIAETKNTQEWRLHFTSSVWFHPQATHVWGLVPTVVIKLQMCNHGPRNAYEKPSKKRGGRKSFGIF